MSDEAGNTITNSKSIKVYLPIILTLTYMSRSMFDNETVKRYLQQYLSANSNTPANNQPINEYSYTVYLQLNIFENLTENGAVV